MNSKVRIQQLPIYTAILVTIVVIPSLMDPINLPKLWVLSLGAGLSCAVFSVQILSLWNSPRRAVLIVSFAFLGALLMSSIASSQETFRTLVGVWGRNNGALTYFALLSIFLSLSSVKSADTPRYLIRTMGFLGIFFALYGGMQSIGADLIKWENTGNAIILTLGNSNFASALFALMAIATLTMILQTKLQTWKRFALLASYLIQAYLTHKSEALQGFLVLLLGSAILIGFWMTFSNRALLKGLALVWWGILLGAGAFAVSGLTGSGPLSNFLNPNLASLKDRYYHWIAALNMLKDNLVFGVGIDSFGDYYRKYRTIEGVNFRATPMSGTNNAHNTIMQIGATGGLVLLLAYISLLVFIAHRAFIALRKSDEKILVSGLFSIWIAFQVQSLVSIDQIGLVVWGWAVAGCLVSLSYIDSATIDTKSSKNKRNKIDSELKPKLVFVLIGLLPSVLLIPTLQNEISLRGKLVALVSSGDLESLKSNGLAVVEVASKSSEPELRLRAMDYLLRVELTQDALNLVEKNISQFPNSFESWNSIAEIYERLGQKSKAISYRKRTVELDPLNSEVKRLLTDDLASK